jgi:sulfite exporter TauE/SafE
MNLPAINGPSAAFIAGAITSIHCLGMCGPLACYLAGGNQQRRTVYLSTVTYHGGRILSYTFLGALAGGLGKGLSQWFPFLSGNWLPWAFILFFLLLILGLEKKFQPSAGLVGRCLGALQARAARMHPVARSGLVGLGTPLLPCGPLYLVLGVALLSGSALAGGLLMLSFSLGTVFLLALLQLNIPLLENKLNPQRTRVLQRVLAAVTIGIMVWRAAMGEPMFTESPGCPMCH